MPTATMKELARAATKPTEKLAFDPENLPLKCSLWHITVAPVKPRATSDGGIVIPDEAQGAEAHLVCVGKILDVGDLAYQAKTPSGLDLAKSKRNPVVGEFVLFDQHAGTRVVFRDGRTLILLTDTEIKAVVKPEEVANIRFYL